MGRYSVKRYKTKRYARDVDQIFDDDFASNQIKKLTDQEIDEAKPGLGQFYCIACVRYFESDVAIKDHLKTKRHKRRLKEFETRPYSKEEADAAAGQDVQKYQAKQQRQAERRAEEQVNEVLTRKKSEPEPEPGTESPVVAAEVAMAD